MDPWTFMQLADSALPTGGFAHSGGLEAAVQLGRTGEESLSAFVEETLWNAGACALPFVAEGHAAPESLPHLDRCCDASLPGLVTNRASRLQGQAFLRAAAAAYPLRLAPLALELESERSPCHLAPLFGAVLRHLGATLDEAQRLFLFQVARGVLSAAVRLGLVGPLEAQHLLAGTAATARAVLQSASRSAEEAASSSPLLDLWQSHQDRLYSRLFRS